MRQIIPLSFVFSPFEGCALTTSENSFWQMFDTTKALGLGRDLTSPTSKTGPFRIFDDSIGLLTERIENISFAKIIDHCLSSESMRQVLNHGPSSSIFKYFFLWQHLDLEVDFGRIFLSAGTGYEK